MKPLGLFMWLLLLCTIFAVSKCGAQNIGIDVASVHRYAGANSFNPGVYVTLDNGLSGGTYFNSESRTTFWGGYTWPSRDSRFAITFGAATGYKRAALVPIVVPSVRFGLSEGVSLRLSLAAAKANPALHLSMEMRLK